MSGLDAQDAWLRNLVMKGRIAEQLGLTERATTSYARLEPHMLSGDADHPLLVERRADWHASAFPTRAGKILVSNVYMKRLVLLLDALNRVAGPATQPP